MRLIAPSTIAHCHVFLYRMTRGLIGANILGRRILLLTTTGAKTDKKRTAALLYMEDPAALVLIASFGGSPRHPAWYINLLRHPRCTVQVGGRQLPMVAETVPDEERERLWAKAVKTFGGYADYQRRTTRRIPLVRLKPAAS